VKLPAGRGNYRLSTSLTRGPAWANLSRRIDATWTFSSSRPAAGKRQDLPLQAVRFSPQLDRDNIAPAGRFQIPLTAERVPGSVNATVRSIAVDVSYDGGKTWKTVPLTGSGASRVATVTNPVSGTVSLRAKVVDSAGDTVEQTIITAYVVK
jgi:hypothetical protein